MSFDGGVLTDQFLCGSRRISAFSAFNGNSNAESGRDTLRTAEKIKTSPV
jgi:hypothetical protein